MDVETIHVENHKLSREEVSMIRTQIKRLYRQGYSITEVIHLGKAGTIIVFAKDSSKQN